MSLEAWIYMTCIVFWVCVTLYVYFKSKSFVYTVVCMFPLVCLGLLYYNLESISDDIVTYIIQPSMLPLGIVLAYGLMDKMKTVNQGHDLLAICMYGALAFSVISVPPYFFGNVHIVRTLLIKLAMQIISCGLFLVALSVYFLDPTGKIRKYT